MADNSPRSYEELEQENQLLKTILDSIHEGVYVVSDKEDIILYNSEVEKIEGMKRADVLGKKEREVYSFLKESLYSSVIRKQVLKTGKPVIEQTQTYYLPDGRKINLFFSTFPFYFKNKITAVYTIGHNPLSVGDFISKTLEMQNRLIREEDKFQNGAKYFLEDIIGSSDKIGEAVAMAKKVARNNSPVLIVGETGTGKELFAQGIHNASLQSKGHFIPVNCAAIPDSLLESILFGTTKGAFTGAVDMPGLFEQAENGTIFLDEINSMPFSLQAKLLRVLQDKVVRRIGGKTENPVHCRVISATNINPFALLDEKEQVIRTDLFFRLATVSVTIPPLRERKDDIKELTGHFIKKYNIKFGLFVQDISNELLRLFSQYQWPGNVRELENLIESAMNFVETGDQKIELEHLPAYFRERLLQGKQVLHTAIEFNGTLRSTLLEFEKKVIEDVLKKHNGNVTKAANELGILRQNLHYKIRTFGINIKKRNQSE